MKKITSYRIALAAGCLVACLGVPAQADVPLRVDTVEVYKSKRKMSLLVQGKALHTYHIALGAQPKGHKQQEGDERTPEGKYVLDYRQPQSSFYKSIHISYPNAKDRARAQAAGVHPGGSIMIHGQANGFGWFGRVTQHFNWTDGCIAVTNDEMEEIWKLVPLGTSIEIFP